MLMTRHYNVIQIVNFVIFILSNSHFSLADFQIISHYSPQQFRLVDLLQIMNFQVLLTFTFMPQFLIINPLYYFVSYNQ